MLDDDAYSKVWTRVEDSAWNRSLEALRGGPHTIVGSVTASSVWNRMRDFSFPVRDTIAEFPTW